MLGRALGAERVTLSAAEVAELDRGMAPTALYPNWFQASITDTEVRDALKGNTEKG